MEGEIEQMTVIQLKEFLRLRGKRCSGRKSELLALAKLFKDDPVLPTATSSRSLKTPGTNTIFAKGTLDWHDITSLKSGDVPENFNIEVLTAFLTSQFLDVDGESIHSGTEKPAVKGRQLYASKKIQLCEYSVDDSLVLFRCNMAASMRNMFRLE